MLEELLAKIGKRKIYSLLLGILYVLVSYGTATVFFPAHVSLATIFLTTLLLIPSTTKLVGVEERIERRHGFNKFFKEHYVLMEIFLFLFIGIFIGYLIIGNYSPNSIDYQKSFLEKQGAIFSLKSIENFPKLASIIANNVSVIVIAFVLSLFYGVGALFLIVLNASIFSSFILKALEMLPQKTSAIILSVHFVPEVFGFLLAAIAGGVISKALTRERIGSTSFRNVVKDATVLLVLSVIIIVMAALLEVFVTPIGLS